MIWHLYTLQIDHHGKSSNPLSPDKEAVWLTIFSMLFYIPLTFYKWKFVALNSLHLFHSAPPNPALLYLRVCFYLFVCFVIKIQHKSIIIGYVSFYVWLISLSMVPLGPSMLFQEVRFNTLYDWVMFHCFYIPYLLHLVSYWWTFTLFPYLGYYK